MNKILSFEEWLEERCFNIHPMVLDDDMPNFFDNWLVELDVNYMLARGEEYGEYIKKHVRLELQKFSNTLI